MSRRVKYLIVGFSVAGWWAARSIRSYDPQGTILAVSEEEGPYSRPLITYLLGRRVAEATYWGEAIRTQNVDVLWNSKAVYIDPGAKVVRLSSGDEVTFEKALIATGSIPIVPPIVGTELEGVFTLTRKSDVDALQEYLRRVSGKKVLIVGGGFIGLKTCEAFLDLGLQITLVELAPRLLQAMLDDTGSRYLEKALERHGVHVITGDTVHAFVGRNGRVVGAELKSGMFVEADLAVVAVGVRPSIDWLRDSGLRLGRGIIVSEYQETSCSGVFAAGDVAETRHLITGERTVVAIWPEAVRQGKVAGKNMAGIQAVYPGSLPMNVLEVGDFALASCGVVNPPEGDFVVLAREEENRYRKCVLAGERLIGCVLVGNIERAGIFVHLIRERVPVVSFQKRLLDDDFSLVALPSEYRKHMILGVGVEV